MKNVNARHSYLILNDMRRNSCLKKITAGVSCDDVYLRYVFLLIAYDGAGYKDAAIIVIEFCFFQPAIFVSSYF